MVSQANYFRDDVSGRLYDTPAEAIESEIIYRNRKEYLADIHQCHW